MEFSQIFGAWVFHVLGDGFYGEIDLRSGSKFRSCLLVGILSNSHVFAVSSNKIKKNGDSHPSMFPASELVTVGSNDPVDLKEFIRRIAVWKHKNLILDSKDLGKISILAPKKVTKEEAYLIFLSAMNYLNLSVVETGHLMRVQQKRDSLSGNNVPVLDSSARDYSDRIATQIFPLKYVGVETMRSLLANLVVSNSLLAYAPGNSIIHTDTGNALRKISNFISLIDRKEAAQVRDFIHIKHVFASDLAKQLNELIKGQTSNAAPQILVIEGNNTLMLSGSLNKVRELENMIAELDKPAPNSEIAQSRIYVRPLFFSDAKKVSTVLNSVITPGFKKGNLANKKDTKIDISSDDQTNSLLIRGGYSEYRSLSSIIRKLDAEKAQVFLECEVLVLKNDNNMNSLPSYLLGLANKDGSGVKTIIGYQASTMAPLIVAQNSGSNNVSASNPALSSFGKDLTIGSFLGKQVDLPGFGKITPAAIISLIKEDVNGRTLSSPRILALDNEDVSFSVGETFFYTSAKMDSSGNISEVPEKENVDLTMKFKPTMTGDNSLNMVFEIESSSVGGFTSQNIPQISKRKARQLINLKNHQTVLISGIRNLRRSELVQQVPLLGSIPVIGFFFRNKKVSYSMDQTFIFVTAHVLRTPQDLQSLYEEKYKSLDTKQARTVMKTNVQDRSGQRGLE